MAGMSTYIGPAMTIAGSLFSSQQNRAAGAQEQQAAEFRAQQLEVNAGQQQAAAQRAALDERRRARFAQSRALAIASVSGGGSDPTVVDIIGELAGEGEYRAMTDLYQGEEAARQLRMGAAGARFQGAAARQNYDAAATSSLIRGGMSLFSKYQSPGATAVGARSFDAGTPVMSPYG